MYKNYDMIDVNTVYDLIDFLDENNNFNNEIYQEINGYYLFVSSNYKVLIEYNEEENLYNINTENYLDISDCYQVTIECDSEGIAILNEIELTILGDMLGF